MLAGIMLIIAGLILAANILNSIPGIGPAIARAGHWLARIGSPFGIACLVIGIIELL
jgi:hypothetical protein